MQVRIWPASLPPPMASKASVAPVATSACGQIVHEARRAWNRRRAWRRCRAGSLACSALRTMLTRPMPSLRQILLSIWPRFEAAAVCTSALWPSRRIVSTMPSAVSGLTKQDAPSAGVDAGGQRQALGGLAACDTAHTWRRRSSPPSCPAAPGPRRTSPALTTTPAPSLPTGIDWSDPRRHGAHRRGRAPWR